MSGPFLVPLDTSGRFRSPVYSKAWSRWFRAKAAWRTTWETGKVSRDGVHWVSLYTPDLSNVAEEFLPQAIEYYNARRGYFKVLRMIPKDTNNPWMVKYRVRSPVAARTS